jgi:DNA-binding XRE family transcriptional regulator
MSYKSNLKQYRISHNLTQKAMADKCGINIRLYQYYEVKEREPSISNALKIAKALDIPVEQLFSLTDE